MPEVEEATEPQADTNPGSEPPQDIARQENGLSRTGAISVGMMPRNFDEAYRMASVFAKTDMVPKNYKGKPDDILVAMQYGAEIGLPPMASLQSVAVINGKPGIYGDGFLGVIMSTRAYLKHEEYYLVNGERRELLTPADLDRGDTTAVAKFWRRGDPAPKIGTFSVDDAKKAKLWGKDGPWTNYPARQMRWRARGFAGRDAFAGELRGIRMAEELLDFRDEPAIDVEVSTAPITEPVRKSEKVTAPEVPVATGTATPHAAKRTTAPTPAAAPGGPFKNLAPAVTTPKMRIIETALLAGKDRIYEVKAETKDAAFVFVTVDEALYQAAASCEGSEALFDVRWMGGKREDGKTTCKVLVAIEAAS